MGDAFTGFLVILIILAAVTRETFLFVLLYLFVGATLLGRWWTGNVVNRVIFNRRLDHQAFPGEIVPVRIEIENRSLLPAIWMRVQDYYPIEVADTNSFSEVISLGPREKARLTYNLKAHKRGYYTIGPLHIASGDLLGMTAERQSQGKADHLTVYPRVIPLTEVRLPSQSPMGTMRHKQPIFEDPTRIMGKRDYQRGDSLRRIDWKSTASSGRMQTKLFEPSIALETVLFLDLNLNSYQLRSRYEATELAIVVAASLATWVISKRQSTGLISNGLDPLSSDSLPVPLHPDKGRGQLMRVLETLARIRAIETEALPELVRRHRVRLSWGTTAILITGSVERELFHELVQARRGGINPVLVLCGEHPNHRQTAREGKLFGVTVHIIRDERDLDIWRL